MGPAGSMSWWWARASNTRAPGNNRVATPRMTGHLLPQPPALQAEHALGLAGGEGRAYSGLRCCSMSCFRIDSGAPRRRKIKPPRFRCSWMGLSFQVGNRPGPLGSKRHPEPAQRPWMVVVHDRIAALILSTVTSGARAAARMRASRAVSSAAAACMSVILSCGTTTAPWRSA